MAVASLVDEVQTIVPAAYPVLNALLLFLVRATVMSGETGQPLSFSHLFSVQCTVLRM